MKNKILIELIVPDIDKKYDVYIPVNKKIGNIILLLNKAIFDMNNGLYAGSNNSCLYNRSTNHKYQINDSIKNTDIRNGTTLILI